MLFLYKHMPHLIEDSPYYMFWLQNVLLMKAVEFSRHTYSGYKTTWNGWQV